jgi:putrescine importer
MSPHIATQQVADRKASVFQDAYGHFIGGSKGPNGVRLKENTIGPLGLAALAIGITSPAMGLYALWGTMQTMTGPITPLIFLSGMLLTLPTAISYAVLNSRAPSAGAASTWLWKSISPSAGYLAGLMMMTYFFMCIVGCPLLFATFFDDLLRMMHTPISSMAGLYVGVIVATIPIVFSCLRGAEASIKTTVRLMIAETVVVMALSATILFVKGAETGGVNFAAFDAGRASNGLAGFWAAMIPGALAFCGFDVVSTAAEEARAPKKYLPKAILFTVVGIAVFWALNAWVFTLSVPVEKVREYTRLGLPAVMYVAQSYWGWGSLIVVLTAFTSVTAVYIGCVQGASRIIFALARHSLLPSVFARLTGTRRVPRNAVLGVVGFAVSLDFATLFLLHNGLDSFNWWVSATVFFATLTFMAVNIANTAYFFRLARSSFSVLRNLLVPIAGFALNAYLIYAAFFSALWSSDLRMGKSVVVGCVALLATEIVVVLCMRRLAPQLFGRGAPIEVDGGVMLPHR